ncbi:MAG: hypothetical protein D6702_06535 [Planctomycetota bacterium]|nr:MAG: hypothetical protein D6702_06535 [Planctomycetota bacterium]
MLRSLLPLLLAALAAGWLGALGQEPDRFPIEPRCRHLGDDATPEWPEAPAEPEAAPIEVAFLLPQAPAGEATLSWRQRHVDGTWRLFLNGALVAVLPPGAERTRHHCAIPAGVLRAGRNLLRLEGRDPADDITWGEAELVLAPLEQVLELGRIEIEVVDDHGRPLPARLTLRTAGGGLPPLHPAAGADPVPLRPGLAYTGPNGRADFLAPAGHLELTVSRGVEWGLDRSRFELAIGGRAVIRAVLERQFETPGFVAADTHIHTLTFSGHGDARLDERVATLAGEGVEFAVATDHNHQTDYRPRQRELGFSPWYTAVTGNEVTTSNGHFNAFPLPADGPLPDHRLTDWVRLVADIRAKGARVVILNHPRWPAGDGPFDRAGLDPATGASRALLELPMDAVELLNSTFPEVHPDPILADWFGLLNSGRFLTGVGSSDSHTVGDPVGQGRTYLASSTDDPGAIDPEEMAEALVAGRASCSLGLYAELRAGGRPVMGELLSPAEAADGVQVRVCAPHWSRPEVVSLYQDGVLIEERAVPAEPDRPTDLLLDFRLPPLRHDSWLAAVVRGPRVEEAFWHTRMPCSMAVTNPVRLDDGDGVWRSLAAQAADLLGPPGRPTTELLPVLQGLDRPLLEQTARLLAERRDGSLDRLAALPGRHQALFRSLLRTLQE